MTTAQEIATALGNDGQNFVTALGVTMDELAAEAKGSRAWRDGYRTGDTYRLNFPDGSAIVVAGCAWDFCLDQSETNCFCWECGNSGATHEQPCPLAE